jgi:putative CocE/NonD family hydrolase
MQFRKIVSALGEILGLTCLRSRLISWYLGLPRPTQRVVVERDVDVPMRDGTRLSADIYKPKKTGSGAPPGYPVIAVRTPYGKRNKEHRHSLMGDIFSTHGYVFLVQDVRGKYDSEGDFYPLLQESNDGEDTIRWIASQAWGNGKMGMFGASYFASTQWLAAVSGLPYLKALVPMMVPQSAYQMWLDGGVYRWNQTLLWHWLNQSSEARQLDEVDWRQAVWSLPLREADGAFSGKSDAFRDWMSHPVPDDFWSAMSADHRVESIKAPALMMAGWFDPFLEPMLEDYRRMTGEGGSQEARASRLIIGPWTHGLAHRFRHIRFGKTAGATRQIAAILKWYDHWLKEPEGGFREEDPVKIFVMGRNVWRTEKEWPPQRADEIDYYLHSAGGAGQPESHGSLRAELPLEEKPDSYVYDPADPAPTAGGRLVFDNVPVGPQDHGKIGERKDVLTYTTAPLERDMEVTGTVRLCLYASSSARDTDFVARLLDIYPDGKAINLASGIIRGRFRDSTAYATFLVPGERYRFDIRVGSTSNLFARGHRVGLQISSSDFPKYDRNLNTGGAIGRSKEMERANQTIYHDRQSPSYLRLPVMPVG